jgi:hypothetical protein
MSKTQRSEHKPLWKQNAEWCIHFNGIMEKTCRAGISYDDPKFGGRQPYRRELPCLKENWSDPTRTDICDKCEYLTEEQAKAKAEESTRRIRAHFERMASGVCPDCDQKIERQRQVGPCVYAVPCGHRMFQGRAS